MLTSQEAWSILLEHAPRGQWLRVRDLYALVEDHWALDETDRALVAEKGTSARWHRAVRNALQTHKRRGEVEWESRTGFRFPTA